MPSRTPCIGIGIAIVTAGFVAIAAAASPGDRRTVATDPAGEVLDQESASATLRWARCRTSGLGMYQSFRPRSTPLSAVALDLRHVPAGGDSVRVRLRAGAPEGRVLGVASVFVTAEGWIRFAFGDDIAVELDHDYVIEWLGAGAWWACSDEDPYARGFAYNCGAELLPSRDFNFRTYAPTAHWQAITWSALRRLVAAAGAGNQERGSTSSRVEGGNAR